MYILLEIDIDGTVNDIVEFYFSTYSEAEEYANKRGYYRKKGSDSFYPDCDSAVSCLEPMYVRGWSGQ